MNDERLFTKSSLDNIIDIELEMQPRVENLFNFYFYYLQKSDNQLIKQSKRMTFKRTFPYSYDLFWYGSGNL